MSRSGAPDSLYVAARRALLDALEAVVDHLDAVVLVGAQAIYLHVGEGDLAVAPFTTDGDLAIDPSKLRETPRLEDALMLAGFTKEPDVVGIWQRSISVDGTPRMVAVDLLVPASLGGEGRRGARIPPHSKAAARKVIGLEGALVDRSLHEIQSFEAIDPRSIMLNVAGPGALLVAKLHKIGERAETMDRLRDKDALDVLRLLRGVSTEQLVHSIGRLLENPVSNSTTAVALEMLPRLFGNMTATGTQMVARAAGPLENSDTIRASVVALSDALMREL